MKPKLLVIAGPNGSGKTSVTSKILRHEWVKGCVYVNPDNIARDVYGDWNSPDAVMKAVRYATERRELCLKNREDLMFETVLSAKDKYVNHDHLRHLRAQKQIATLDCAKYNNQKQ